MPSKMKKYLLIGLVTIMISTFIGCISLFSKNQEGPGFYKIGRDDLKKVAKSLGYSENFSWFFDRNSTGSMLRLFNWNDKIALVMSCDGQIKEIPLKGQRCWLNDSLEIVAWFDNQRLYFDDEEVASSEEYIYRQEFSGNYFSKSPKWGYSNPSNFKTEIFSVDRPEQPLIEEVGIDSTARLFTKNNKIYLTGDFGTDRNAIKFYIYEIKNGGLTKINELTLKRDREGSSPFYVVDISPWNNEVMVVDTHDFPSPSKLFVFNLLTQEKISLGRSYGTEGFYMQCNILNEVLRKRGL